MKKSFSMFLVALSSTLLFGIFALATGEGPQDNAAKPKAKSVVQKCLGCHGPYDKIAAATAKFKASSGETVTPHQYVPHEEKKDIPECTECHKPHEIPLKDKSAVAQSANVDWCYTSCHHANNLQPCSDCH
jgi:hypothetical protein